MPRVNPVRSESLRQPSELLSETEAIRALVAAHVRGDEPAFQAAVRALAEHERRVNRPAFAAELERSLGAGRASSRDIPNLLAPNGNAPRDKDKNAPLVELTQPRRELEELILAPAVSEGLGRIVREWRQADLLRAHGLRPLGKVLFHGPPGCGKTAAAEALAHALYMPLATVRFDAVVSSFLGETASNLRKVFDYARAQPMVLLFDEFDAIGRQRAAAEEHGELKRVVSTFLQLLDGFRAGTLTIAATNHEGLLDEALWRRFDAVVRFPLPTREELATILTRQFRQMTVSRGVRLAESAHSLEGASHADAERVALEAIKDTILESGEQVEPRSIEAAIERLRGRRNSPSPPPRPKNRRTKPDAAPPYG